MNSSVKSNTLSSRLFAIASRIQTAHGCQQVDTYRIDQAFVAKCSDFASSEHDLRIIALLYKNLLNPDERRAHMQMNVRLLLGMCFGTHAIAQVIDHLQSMINRDLVQLDYHVSNQHDHILGFTSAGLGATVQLTDRALFCIQNAEADMLSAEATEQHDESIADDDSNLVIEYAEECEKDDNDDFFSSPQGEAINEMFGKKSLFEKEELPEAFTYIPDEAIRDQFEEIIALCGTDMAARMREYGLGNITVHAKKARHERVIILLSGASGTGKTAAAYALAQELNRELYLTSVDVLNSPYYGIYERNTRRVMREFRELSISKDAAPILLIDECEVLFTERTKAQQSGDRAHNSVIDVLLQEMERFEGILILTTNTPDVFDDAFRRRLDYTMHLSGTSKDTQRALWRHRLPVAMPGADTINVEMLVAEYNLTAADIPLVIKKAVTTAIRRNPANPVLTQEIISNACRQYLFGSSEANAPYGFV